MTELPTGVATGIGSMPGEDVVEATRIVLGELPDLPHQPEAPARSESASTIGRSLALLVDLAVDLQPAGWRLTDAPGIDQRRAVSLLAHDLDVLEEQAQGLAGPLKLQVAGPWTVAANVERPRGDKVLADHGARRDLGQSLAEGVALHLRDVRRRLPDCEPVLQIDEPSLPAVLAAQVPTASGFGRHRSVDVPTAVALLQGVVEAAADVPVVMHCCAPRVPVGVFVRAGAGAVSVDAALIGEGEHGAYAAAIDAGINAWLGVVPTQRPDRPPSPDAVAGQVRRLISRWGFDPERAAEMVVVTPSCGLAGATADWARNALSLAREAARQLSVEQGRMVP